MFLNFKLDLQFFASKKGVGSVKNGRDSISKRRGIKISDGQFVEKGGIICRQLGKRFLCGENTSYGKDNTIFSLIAGYAHFKCKHIKYGKKKVIISVFETRQPN